MFGRGIGRNGQLAVKLRSVADGKTWIPGNEGFVRMEREQVASSFLFNGFLVFQLDTMGAVCGLWLVHDTIFLSLDQS